MSETCAARVGAANPTRATPARSDEELLRAILATPRVAPRHRRRVTIVIACCVLVLGASGAYAALGGMDAAGIDATLAQSARDARPLTTGEIETIRRSNAADEALYRCLRGTRNADGRSGGLTPTPAVRSTCAPQAGAADALRRDPAVRAAFAAEAMLVGAAWYCVQQQGYEVNGNRITTEPSPSQRAAIWRAFATCEAKVGVPVADRARTP